jgi:hypothetical protein
MYLAPYGLVFPVVAALVGRWVSVALGMVLAI